MARSITIKDIAKELNISVSTVSRALRNTYDVNPETREKVLAMAGALHYRPSSDVTGLVSRSSHYLAVVIPFVTSYHFPMLIRGIQEVAYQHDYDIILYITNNAPLRELSIIRNLAVPNLDGFLISVSSGSDATTRYQKIINTGTPVVFFDQVPDNVKASRVMQDDYSSAFEAVAHLFERGYRNIGHITGPDGPGSAQKRKRGFLDALKKYRLPVKKQWVIHSGFSQADGQADTVELLKQKERPDAIFAVNGHKAIGAMNALKDAGIAIGKEIGVIGVTGDPAATIVSPTLSAIAEPAFEIGKKSCELLLKHIGRRSFMPEDLLLPGTLIARESTLREPLQPCK